MGFNRNLKQKLIEKAMTQSELADAIGKTNASISHYISGRSIPENDVKRKIAEVLGTTLEELNQENEDDLSVQDTSLSVSQAAKLLGKCEQFVRVSLQTGTAPFGFATKIKTRWSYHISKKKLEEYLQ